MRLLIMTALLASSVGAAAQEMPGSGVSRMFRDSMGVRGAGSSDARTTPKDGGAAFVAPVGPRTFTHDKDRVVPPRRSNPMPSPMTGDLGIGLDMPGKPMVVWPPDIKPGLRAPPGTGGPMLPQRPTMEPGLRAPAHLNSS
jgi:hypothetical protein